MTDQTQHTWEWIDRRTVLKGVGVATGTALVGTGFTGLGGATASELEFTVTQDGERLGCITPLRYEDDEGLMDVVDFYNYHSEAKPGGPNTPTNLEADDHSRLFLYEDENGVSLVFLHDDYDPEKSSATKERHADLTFDGLPAGDGEEWHEIEQTREGEDYYGTDEARWEWFPRYSDGGAYGHLTCDFEITIGADFFVSGQEESWLMDDGWTVLSGSAEDPDVIELDPDKEVTLTCGCCDECAFEGTKKFEFDEDEDAFLLEDDDGFEEITYVSYESKEDEDQEPIAVTFESDTCLDELDVVVKAGPDTATITPEATADGFVVSIEDEETFENRVGKVRAISYISFECVD